jgi:ATP-dependent RNA helicase RhlE
MKFDDYSINEGIKKSLHKLNFVRPTDIQYKTIPALLKGEDILAIAQTGTGKTAAFAIPIIHLIDENKQTQRRKDGIKCLVMVPTHELALQIHEVFESLAENTLVKTMSLFGGVEQDPQIATLNKGVDILIATPGRVFDLVHQGHLLLHRVEILVLDEADHMLEIGFIKDIQDLMRHLPKKRQTLFFSATINEKIKKVAYSLVKSAAIRIQISPKDPVAKNVNHSVAFVEMDDKRFFMERIIRENPESKILIFVRTKVRAERVQKALARVEIASETIHSDRDQADRVKVLDDFRKNKIQILIATDVSARGIDIPNVDYVINYDLPDLAENYVHRVGRTGRGRAKGQALSLCSTDEKNMLTEIESYVTKPITRLDISKKAYQETLDIAKETNNDWKSVVNLIADEVKAYEERKKKKKK